MATEILINSINFMFSRDKVKCVSKIDHFKFHQYALIPAILITLSFAMLRKRRNVLLSVLWGRPGLPVPMDSMTRVARISYACAFGATTNLVYQIVVANQYAVDGSGHPIWKSVIAVVSVFIYGMVFYPLFASLAIGSVFGYGLGTLYVWMLTAIEIYRLTECDTNAVGRTAVIFRSLPLLLCLGYLSFSIPTRVYRAAKRGRLLVWECDLEVKDRMSDIVNSHEGRHITKLLHKPAVTVVGGQRLGWQYTVFSWIHRQRYRWRKGFRYPSRLLAVILVGMMVVYMATVELLILLLAIADFLQPSKPSMDLLNYPNSTDTSPDDITMKMSNTLRVSTILSCTLAFIFSLGNALHMLACFRRNLVALYKGDHTNIPKAIGFNYSILCLGCLKFGGFQVAYIVCGFLVQWLMLFISLIVISNFIVFPHLLVWILQNIWPWLLSLVIMLLLQRLLVIFFLQERGRYLALDNRGSYFVFTYFMFFYNIFVGLGSFTLRSFKSMIIGTFILSRLDYSLMPNKFENWDPGFSAYVGYMQMEYAHTHPVLQIFTRLLLVERRNGGSMNCDEFSSLSEMGACGGAGSRSNKVGGRVRRKWHVLYTLVRNPSLVYTRKVFNQTIATRTLATKPNSDSGPPPQNVCVSLA